MPDMLPSPPHVTDEECLLDFYGETSEGERTRIRAHLAGCPQCRALESELRGILALIDRAPMAEAPEGFEREMWARVQAQLPEKASVRWSWWPAAPRLAFAAGIAALVTGAFLAGRFSGTPPVPQVADEAIAEGDLRERLLSSELGDHLERSQRVLVELVNADASMSGPTGGEQARAAELVTYGRLYRRSAEDSGDAELSELLDDLERVLIEIANGSPGATQNDLADVRSRIDQQDLVFRVRLVAAELRERERRSWGTW